MQDVLPSSTIKYGVDLSVDGKTIIFNRNLYQPSDGNLLYQDVYIYDRVTGTSINLTAVDIPDLSTLYDTQGGSISPDSEGRYIVYKADTEGPTYGSIYLALYDRLQNSSQLIHDGDDIFLQPSETLHTTDGSQIFFNRPKDGSIEKIFVYDRSTEAITQLTPAYDGGDINNHAQHFDITPDGRFLVFDSEATNIIPNDTNNQPDIFILELESEPSLFPGQDWNVECPFCNVEGTQGVEYGINTRTGNFGHMDTALSLPTAGGSLDFRYGYISQATAMYTTTMGFGWVHNNELQLDISDPSPTHTVILQAPGGSRFPYAGNGDGTYTPYAGVTAEMVYNSSADEFVVTTF
ncbi:MAG: DUF6531 domain-containing protein [Chloroflexi bacterium]|nr:DUF6531 domain-containing protein [Chloroflexota bacterium]